MAWPEGATRVVNQFPCRGQTIWLDFKFFPLHKEERCQRNEQEQSFSHTATRDSCGLMRASDRTWRNSTGRPTALPHARLAATGRWPPFHHTHQKGQLPDVWPGKVVEELANVIHLLQHIKLRVTQGLAGTGWNQRCAKNLQTTKNLRYVEPGVCRGGRGATGRGEDRELGRVNATPEGFHSSLLPDRCAFLSGSGPG